MRQKYLLLSMTALLVSLCVVPTAYAQKKIYLTFDMDMNQSMYQKTATTGKQWYDPNLFSYLKNNHIPATFFVSGLFLKAYSPLIEELAATDEFSFENHSWDESSFVPHCYWLQTLGNTQEKTAQIQETEAIITQETGQTATYFRFPGVCHDAANDTLVESLGYLINDGSIIPSDPFNHDTAGMVKTVLEEAKDGATILMHVGGPNAPESLSVLKQIVPSLEASGYMFVKLQ